ncbi:unnamed protein product [Camellia sinensis]
MPIAEIFLSAFVKLLFEKMTSFASSKLPTFEGIGAQLTNWTNMLSQIEALLIDAEEKQMTDRAVNLWLDDLQDLAYDLDDVVDEFATEALRQSLKAKPHQASSSKVWNPILNFKPGDVWFNFKMRSKIEEITTRLRTSFELLNSDWSDCLRSVEGDFGGGVLGLAKVEKAAWRNAELSARARGGAGRAGSGEEAGGHGGEERGCASGGEAELWRWSWRLRWHTGGSGAVLLRLLLLRSGGRPRRGCRPPVKREILRDCGGESSRNKVDVIPIVGMGGIGKTTLAQMVYNDETVKKHFDLKAWVCVSDEFDIMKITKAIYDSVTSQTCSFNNLDQAQVQLKQALVGKKFLIVLDDVWNKKYNDWNDLSSPFNDGAQGSKVVVTTRSRDIARMMATVELHDVEILSDEDCWSLFAQHAFENRSIDANPNLVSIGKKIVEKCKGLPLAAKTLSGLLRCKERDEEWVDVLCSKIWELSHEESDILPAFRLSYHHLPSHLKQCFAYCSIIPNDYEFEEEEIVLLWMAEGFILQKREKQMEDVGGEYFRELLSRSFFQPSSTGKSSKFVMHDLINDLAQVVARETCFRLEDILKYPKQCKNIKKARHSSYMREQYEGMKKFEIFDKAIHLRTFLPFNAPYIWKCHLASKVSLNLLPKLRRLRVLNMSRYYITEVPNSVGDLKHLRYLNLSNTNVEELPESLGSLYNLQTLMLRGCEKLKKLPTDLGNLIDLRHLDITNAHHLEEMPLGIGKLASLQTLSNFIVTKNSGHRLKELGNLIYLRGRLCLSGLQNVVVPLDAREANLIDKEGLDVLSMEWSVNSDDSRDGRVETEVLDMLQPHKDLKELHIKGYLGAGFPTWIGDPLFSNMTDLSLDNCGNCASLPPLGQLPSLKKLYIKGMSVLKHVGREFYGQGGAKPFQLLETLSFKDMLEWEYWYTFEDDKEVEPFTHVRELSIENCPKLVGMLPSYLPCLNNLKIKKCSQLLVEVSKVVHPSLTSIAMNDVPLTSLQAVLEMRSMVDDELISANAKSKHPSSITSLSIGMIKKLELLPKWVTHWLMELEALEITSCEELKTLWKNEERVQRSLSLPAFRHLKIKGCPQLVSLFEEDEDEDNKGQHEQQQQQQQQQEGLTCIVRRLEHLTIDNCEKLEKLPRLLHGFTFLGELYVYKCPSLSSFPETGFPCTLKTLRIGDCEALQSLFGCLTQINDSNLQVLDVCDCPSLTCLISCRGGGLPPTLKQLQIMRCKKLEALLVVDEGMEITCPSLEIVLIMDCDRLKYLPDALPNNNNNNLSNLSGLYLYGCKNLEYIPEGWFHSATNLRDLDIRGCKKLKALPHGLQSINYLTSLQSLEMNISQWNNNFKKIGLRSLSSLRILSMSGAISVAEEEEEGVAGSSFPIDGKLLPTSLINLQIGGFRNLEKLSSKLFQNLASLEELSIFACPRLKSLPVQRLPPSLEALWIRGSRKLTRKCEKGKGKYWPHLAHIPQVNVDDESTTNGRVHISFQLGAFVPGYPVHPVIVCYPLVHFDQSWGNIALGKLMFRMFIVSQCHGVCPNRVVDMIVLTDGSYILGLGDLGVQGTGIPIGKLDMYVAAAGINPQRHLGLQHPRLEGKEYLSIVDEFMEAIHARRPKAIVQWAFERLQRYQKRFCMFNDDMQGTAGVGLAGLLGTVRAQGRPLTDFVNQKIVVVGARSAGLGVFNMAAQTVSRMARAEASPQFFLLDEDVCGLITTERKGAGPAAAPFAKAPGEIKGLGLREGANLVEVVKRVKPHVLLGLSGVGGIFNEQVGSPLAECTAVDAFNHAGENIVFASGSPFKNIDLGNGKVGHVKQANNMYLFPRLDWDGSSSLRCSFDFRWNVASSLNVLASHITEEEIQSAILYPPMRSHITAEVGAAVVRAIVVKELDAESSEEETVRNMWFLAYSPLVHEK